MPLLLTGAGGAGGPPVAPYYPATIGGYLGTLGPIDGTRSWLDTAGTTLAGDGDSLARWSLANGLEPFTQAMSASRPTHWLDGDFYYAEFDGGDDQLVNSTLATMGATPFTVAGWLWMDGNGNFPMAFTLPDQLFEWRCVAGGRVLTATTTVGAAAVSTPIPLGTWVFAAAWYDPSGPSVGVRCAGETGSGSLGVPLPARTGATVGARHAADNYFWPGRIGPLHLYSAVLSAGQLDGIEALGRV